MAKPGEAIPVDVEIGQPSPSSRHAFGVRITFRDLSYTVPSNKEKGAKVKLLDGVSAFFEPGQMTALMGPSGSGKTTLLDVLAGRTTNGVLSGTLQYGGSAPSPAYLRRYTGLVEQFDTLVGDLTVSEMLMYTAELKRPRSEPHQHKAEAVAQLIDRLGLTSCKDTVIGNSLTKGISGGQQKRTNIGIALIADPRVLMLDEPTSGLDSFSANEVMTLVQGLSRDGRTVVATIHSPSAYAFSLFDAVLMLARGRTVYFGPQGDQALQFAAENWAMDAARAAKVQQLHHHPAEFLVDVITEADRSGQAGALADAYAGSTLAKESLSTLDAYLSQSASSAAPNTRSSCRFLKCKSSKAAITNGAAAVPDASIDEPGHDSSSSSHSSDAQVVAVVASDVQAKVVQGLSGPSHSQLSEAESEEVAKELAVRSSTATSWWWALLTLLRYRTSKNYRNPAWVIPRIADKFLFSFVILTLYLRTGTDFSQSNLTNIPASLFMWCTLPAFGAVAYVPSIVLERRLFVRERADGLYHVGTYLGAKLLEEVMLAVVASLIFSSYVFYGVQYQGNFGLFWIVYFLTLANGIALGYTVAGIAPNMDAANGMLPALVTLHLFFAGQLKTYDSIPKYWSWFSRIDFLRYSWGALMVNNYEDDNPVFTGEDTTVLDYYNMMGVNKWTYVGYLVCFFTFYVFCAYAGLALIKHQKR